MWILHFLPDAWILGFANGVLALGLLAVIISFFAHRIPGLWQIQIPFKIAGIVLLTAGVYFRAGIDVEQAWRERVAEIEARVKAAEQASAEANKTIETRSQQRTQAVRARTEYIRQYVDREVVKYNSQCVIPEPFVQAHNSAAEAPRK